MLRENECGLSAYEFSICISVLIKILYFLWNIIAILITQSILKFVCKPFNIPYDYISYRIVLGSCNVRKVKVSREIIASGNISTRVITYSNISTKYILNLIALQTIGVQFSLNTSEENSVDS